jgi:hypothetical protein
MLVWVRELARLKVGGLAERLNVAAETPNAQIELRNGRRWIQSNAEPWPISSAQTNRQLALAW